MVTFTTNSVDAADIALRQRVEMFLAQRHVPALRQVRVEVRRGTVLLRGRVRTFYEKQLLQQCGRRVAGVIRLFDLVEIDAESNVSPKIGSRASEVQPELYPAAVPSSQAVIENTR